MILRSFGWKETLARIAEAMTVAAAPALVGWAIEEAKKAREKRRQAKESQAKDSVGLRWKSDRHPVNDATGRPLVFSTQAKASKWLERCGHNAAEIEIVPVTVTWPE